MLREYAGVTHSGSERPVLEFRPGALRLIFAALPVFLAWYTGDFGEAPDGISGIQLNHRWIMSWLLPIFIGAVMAYGSTRAGVDPRIRFTAVDPRSHWWSAMLPLLIGSIVLIVCMGLSLGKISGQHVVSLIVPSIVATVVCAVLANMVVTRWWPEPGAALSAYLLLAVFIVVGQFFIGNMVCAFSIDPTLATWMDGQYLEPRVSPMPLWWVAVSLIVAAVNRSIPDDSARLNWVGRGEVQE